MPEDVVTINPQSLYTSWQLSAMLDVGEATLAKARRAGELRSVRKGRRVLFLGEWVLDWLQKEPAEGASGRK
jgi:helix-turn-helix protein